jgi:hypothetical protein
VILVLAAVLGSLVRLDCDRLLLWLLGPPPRCLALRYMLESTGAGFPILSLGAYRVISWL